MKRAAIIAVSALGMFLTAPSAADSKPRSPAPIEDCRVGGAIGAKPSCVRLASAASRTPKYRASVLRDPRCTRPAKALCADKSARKVFAVENGRVVKAMAARFGRAHFRTDNGLFYITWKHKDHVSSIYHVAMPYAMFFDGGKAIHYSARFRRIGFSGQGSHGCINIRAKKKLAWVYRWAPVRTPVLVAR